MSNASKRRDVLAFEQHRPPINARRIAASLLAAAASLSALEACAVDDSSGDPNDAGERDGVSPSSERALGRPPDPLGWGYYYMEPNYKDSTPARPPAQSGAFLDPASAFVTGVTWRETWKNLETANGTFSMDYLNAAQAATDAHSMQYSLQILPGWQGDYDWTPAWYWGLNPPAKYAIMMGNGAVSYKTPLPWDPVFQKEWGKVIAQLASKYGTDPNLKYVVMGGIGHGSESFFAVTDSDYYNANQKAVTSCRLNASGLGCEPGAGNYPDVNTAWIDGTEKLINMYHAKFTGNKSKPLILVLGSPFCDVGAPSCTPHDGHATLDAVVAYAEGLNWAKAPNCLFGLRSDDLSATGPVSPDYSGDKIYNWAQTCPGSGFQFQHAVTAGATTELDDLLNNGLDLDAHFIEVWQSNADDLNLKSKFLQYKADFLP